MIDASGISFRWGVPLLDARHTRIPNFFLEHYHELGIKGSEFLVIIHLAKFQYEKPHAKCYPSVKTIAKEMGYNRSGIQKILARLEEKGLLVRHFRPLTSTLYDFSGFSEKILALWEAAEKK